MFNYIIRRFFVAIPTLLAIITLAFFMVRTAPGGPFDKERALPPEIQANLNKMYHLDESLPKQYVRYLGNILQGDFGPSFQYQDRTVTELISYSFPNSLKLGSISMVISILVGSFLGIFAAINQNTRTDYGIMGFALFGITVPSFVTASLLSLLLGVYLRWLPTGGWGDNWKQIIMPVFCLSLPQIAYISRLMRGSMIEALHANHVRTARAKGISESKVILKHCLKPALIPLLSVLGPTCAGVLTGSVIIEKIFSIPGLGGFFVNGALNRDYTIVMGVVILYGALIIFFNLIVDLLYGLLDPKVRLRHD